MQKKKAKSRSAGQPAASKPAAASAPSATPASASACLPAARTGVRNVCVYCGSGTGKDPAYAAAARTFGAALAAWGLGAIRRPLDAAVEQSRALQEGRFVTVPEPRVAELRPLARSMNTMVGRLGALFDAQARQVETLRELAQTDALTGLSNRRQFMLDAQQLIESAGAGGAGLDLLVDHPVALPDDALRTHIKSRESSNRILQGARARRGGPRLRRGGGRASRGRAA